MVHDPKEIIEVFKARSLFSKDLIYLIREVSDLYLEKTSSVRKVEVLTYFFGILFKLSKFEKFSIFESIDEENIDIISNISLVVVVSFIEIETKFSLG